MTSAITPMTSPSTETKPTAETRRSVGRRRYRHAICRERFIAVSLWEWGVGCGEWEQDKTMRRTIHGLISHSPPPTPHPSSSTNLAPPHPVKLKAIIFDIDGTLVDSNDLHARCWIEAFEH